MAQYSRFLMRLDCGWEFEQDTEEIFCLGTPVAGASAGRAH